MVSVRIIVVEASLPADSRVDGITLQALIDRLRQLLEAKSVVGEPMTTRSAEPDAADRDFAWKTLRGIY